MATTPPGPVIDVRNVTKAFPDRSRSPGHSVRALHDVSLQIQAGEIVALAGPNGSGKTTLLKILATLVTPDEGSVLVARFDLAHERDIRRHIGLLTADERSFYWRLTGRQNLQFFASLHGLSSRQGSSRIGLLEQQFAMQAYIDRRFDSYSSGMKQTLALARALLHDPAVLLLDEPTRSLDEQSVERLFDLLRERTEERGGAILFVTHHRDEAQRLASRTLHIDKGSLAAVAGLPAENPT